jgi:hypothetical protein
MENVKSTCTIRCWPSLYKVLVPLLFACLQTSCSTAECDCYLGPTITVHLVDAVSGQPVQAGIDAFSLLASSGISANCEGDLSNRMGPCSSWEFDIYPPDGGLIWTTINVAGYQPAVVTANLQIMQGYCCPTVTGQVDETIQLSK